LQQAIHDGDPLDRQIAQAHVGDYKLVRSALELNAALGIVVFPERTPPASLTHDSEHELTVEHSADVLTLTFGSGTVQRLRWVQAGDVRVFSFADGALALMGNRFILAATVSDGAVAGCGTFVQKNESLLFEAVRWFSVLEGRISYRCDHALRATIGGRQLSFEDGVVLELERTTL
jgi:hypothetical protein